VATHVLVPVKRLQGAKSRLAASYEPEERRALALRMSAGVVAAARAAHGVDRVWVVSSDPEAALLGADVLDDGGLAWNEGLAHAIALLDPLPDAVAIVAGDLPLVASADVEALVAAIPARGVAVARAHDAGSNGLGLRPPDALVPNFGLVGSAAIHAERARAAGLEAVVVDRPGLAHDVDTPQDAERVRALLGPGAVRDLLDHRTPAGPVRPTEAPCR
jgi:2-phospho-L-lactate guanylyltransferase